MQIRHLAKTDDGIFFLAFANPVLHDSIKNRGGYFGWFHRWSAARVICTQHWAQFILKSSMTMFDL